ncbi:hypothetical protein L218DRAFT_1079760 [Marasmius fiardii PR-910]|nr:hypothetical protein L218DRAFT_1082001 [Marasmius fiardii PR-910]KAF9259552.1 hypothetical protein L218DRAFT_1079760 [Marasmius fiardii PR-910]
MNYSPSYSHHWSQNPNSRNPMCYNEYQHQDHPEIYDCPSETEYPQSYSDYTSHHERHSRADPYAHHDHTTAMEGVYTDSDPFLSSCQDQAQMSYPQQWYASDSYSLGDRATGYYPSPSYHGEYEVYSHTTAPSPHIQAPVSSHNSSPYHQSGSSSHRHSPVSAVQETGRKKSWGTPPSRNAHLALQSRVQLSIPAQPDFEGNTWKEWNWGWNWKGNYKNVGLRHSAVDMGPSPLDTSESFGAGGHNHHGQW